MEKEIVHIEYFYDANNADCISLDGLTKKDIVINENLGLIYFGDKLVMNLDVLIMYQFKKVQA